MILYYLLTVSLRDLLDEWHSLVQYVKTYLSPTNTSYLRVWRRVFESSRKDQWSMILIFVELLFTIPISNAKVERLFSLMKRVKRDSRASLNESTLNSLIRISSEGPALDEFDPNPAIELWATSAIRRSNQKARKPYKKKEMQGKRKVFIDDLSLSGSSEEGDDSDTAETESEEIGE